ncbi:putative uncharacterized protein [Prevotella sp. CAG:924]|nr:putative uncharacterized protein [Prevotella sp. CAG:924]
MENIGYFITILVAIILGVIIIKKVASCLIRSIVVLVLLAILGYIYFGILH